MPEPYFYGVVFFTKKVSGQTISVPFTDLQAMMAFAKLKNEQGHEVVCWEYNRDLFSSIRSKEWLY